MSSQSSQANDATDNALSYNNHSRITTLAEVGLSLRVFFAHYRHAPLQAGAILLGIILAVTLLIGVKSTNENAVRSYSEATELLSQRASLLITPNAGERHLDEEVYFRLRQSGISNALAIVNGLVVDPQGRRWQIQGSDLFAAINLQTTQTSSSDNKADSGNSHGNLVNPNIPIAKLLAAENILLMSQSLADKVAPNGEFFLQNPSNEQAPGIKLEVIGLDDDFGLGNAIVADISLAQKLLNQPNQLSYIALFDKPEQLISRINHADLLQQQAGITEQDQGQALQELTRSFHLNLNAMSMLAFVVGLFIAYNGVRYSLMKRQKLLVQLLQLGIQKNHLILSLISELALLVIVGSILGFILGLQLSLWLQPMVAMTLEQLYGARLMPGSWQWQWLTQAMGLTLFAGLLACLPLYRQLTNQPLARISTKVSQVGQLIRIHRIQFTIAVICLIGCALAFPFAKQYQVSLGLMGIVIIAIPLLLPLTIYKISQWLARLFPAGIWHYMIAETKELIGPLSLAMMAMLLALTANISMNTLVGSFEVTLKTWLESRLHADLYMRPSGDKILQIQDFLNDKDKVSGVYTQWTVQSKYQNMPIELVTRDLYSTQVTSSLKSQTNNLWSEFQAGNQILISEPIAIKYNLNIGDTFSIAAFEKSAVNEGQQASAPITIGGIFFDYGNPKGQVVIDQTLWQQVGLPEMPKSIAASYQGDISELEQMLVDSKLISNAQMYNQAKIKQQAITMFKQTFSITMVLNSLTLIVAAIGLFSACLMLTQARQAPLARLYALGITKGQLRLMTFVQMQLIVLLTCLVALPTGAVLGYLLINKVTLQAFGWSIAMLWDWPAYIRVVVIALSTSAIAIAIPLYWQTRKPLIKSLQQEAI
ncbi:ABC transporter permease [Shewanella olleyana]|uniref:ABC transporter permease n=1 Tax=Shewanella olleyana TaxID=135626 RepID=UPI00200D61E3|nr:ABC transporter permease [Shewanella olleyana]MCL1065968.1 ABC transporter permease [Shewanella olleyana]